MLDDATATVARERAASRDVVAHASSASRSRPTRPGSLRRNADAACLAARSVVPTVTSWPAPNGQARSSRPSPARRDAVDVDEDETLGIALEAGGRPLIFRLLRGRPGGDAHVVATPRGR